MGWQPPTEAEFNACWITPLDALDVSDEHMAEDHEKWAVLEQLRAGQIVAVARTAQVAPGIGAVQPFVRISAGAWRRARQSEEYHFWKTGHLVVPGVEKADDYGATLTGDKERYFNVRFDPDSFTGRPPAPMPEETNNPAPVADRAELPPISKADIERFCRAIASQWPEATQDWAYEQAQRFFPDKRIARDQFRSILRSIRGPMKPGRRGKTDL